MRPRPVVRRAWLGLPRQTCPRSQTSLPLRIRQSQRTRSVATNTRPTIYATSPYSSPLNRAYASEPTLRQRWLRHEAKLLVRYLWISVGGVACVAVLYFFYTEEKREREYPTPHEWTFQERKLYRDAHKWTNPEIRVSWSRAFQLARNLCLAFEDENRSGGSIPRLHDMSDPNDEFSWEFVSHDISGKSEEWRRGYFEIIMLAAKAAGQVDGWLRDKHDKNNMAWAPEYVIGPSNPRPTPIPPNAPPAPREEDCYVAFPPAERYYSKILATKGFNERQRLQAILEYANFVELKRRPQDAQALYNMALSVATEGRDQTQLPFNPKTLIIKDKAPAPSANVLDAITAIANYKARNGEAAAALPVYVSLLKARRSLPEQNQQTRISQPVEPKVKPPMYRRILEFLGEPSYPPPPPDGTQPPWRSPEERCQEASLTLYIGEILYASNSHEDGIAWTREGVDISEEQLRGMSHLTKREVQVPKTRCRECLQTGLQNWSVMVTRLAADERARREAKKDGKSGMLSFWGAAETPADGRWEAEGLVVLERMKRTLDLLEDVNRLDKGPTRYFSA